VDNVFELENYLSYFGDKEEVKKDIEECPECGEKLLYTHMKNQENLLIQETGRCFSCHYTKQKKYHVIN